MAGKPKRTRNHELETESQRAFEHALPAALVVRPVSDDYGVDREVEVFVDGEATGLTFKVQLKGTDKSGTSRRVTSSALSYWRSLDVPVLIVSYEAPADQLRARWAHSVVMSASEDGSVPKKITVHMDPTIELDDQWSSNLSRDLILVRELRRGIVPNPLSVRLELAPGLDRLDQTVLMSSLLRASRRGSWPMVHARTDDTAIALGISPARLRAALPLDWASATMSTETGWDSHAELRDLAEDLIIMTATALVPVNDLAARGVALAADPSASAWWSYEVAERLGPVLAHEDSATFLGDIVGALTEAQVFTEHGLPVSELYEHWLMDFVESLTDEQFEDYSLARRDNAQMAPESWETGRQIYNLAHIHKARRDYTRATELLREAATHDPRYATYPDYLRHLAGCEWEIGEYVQSASDYRAAIDAGFEAAEGLPLLADSLTYAGLYEDAAHALSQWSPRGDDRDRLGIVRRLVLEHLVHWLGLKSQVRQLPRDFESRFGDAQSADDGGGALRRLLRETDALAPWPWLALADEDDLAGSFGHLLVAAMVLESVTPVWVMTFISALAAEVDIEVVQALVNQARFHCAEEFYDAVWEAAEQQEEANADYMRQVIATGYAAELTMPGKTLRLVNPPSVGDWVAEEFKVDGSGALLSSPDDLV